MTKQEKELIEVGKKHAMLVKALKEALLVLQIGFLRAAELLYLIKTEKTFRGEDLEHEWTWRDFCARQDLPIPGRTPESRRRTADALVRIHKIFVLNGKLDQKSLAPIGWTKLDLIAPVCEKDNGVIQDWIDRARELTVPDLIAEVKGKGIETTCQHENEYPIFYCPTCGARSKKPMNKKHKEIPESVWK